MKKVSEGILKTNLMVELMQGLSKDEIEDLEAYILEFISPLDDLSALVGDMMSTESTKEKLADDIINLFTPEGSEELEKCLEKN